MEKQGSGEVIPKGQQYYREIPGLLFSKVGDSIMFNATYFISKVDTPGRLFDDYLSERSEIILRYADGLKTESKYMYVKQEGEDTMVAACLALDFACWLVPNLQMHMYEKMHEMFVNGFVASHNYITDNAKRINGNS